MQQNSRGTSIKTRIETLQFMQNPGIGRNDSRGTSIKTRIETVAVDVYGLGADVFERHIH